MCLAVPSKIIRINDLTATIDVMGARREISLMILPEEVNVGDYVLVHAGFAIQKVQEDVALDSLGLINEVVRQMEEDL